MLLLEQGLGGCFALSHAAAAVSSCYWEVGICRGIPFLGVYAICDTPAIPACNNLAFLGIYAVCDAPATSACNNLGLLCRGQCKRRAGGALHCKRKARESYQCVSNPAQTKHVQVLQFSNGLPYGQRHAVGLMSFCNISLLYRGTVMLLAFDSILNHDAWWLVRHCLLVYGC